MKINQYNKNNERHGYWEENYYYKDSEKTYKQKYYI